VERTFARFVDAGIGDDDDVNDCEYIDARFDGTRRFAFDLLTLRASDARSSSPVRRDLPLSTHEHGLVS
jgi:hypothetical protein